MADRSSRTRRRSLGLRSQVTLFFSIAGLLLSVALTIVIFAVARSNLVDQREEAATQQAFLNAQRVRDELRSSRSAGAVQTVRTQGRDGYAVLYLDGVDKFYPKDNAAFTQEDLPVDLRLDLQNGVSAAGFQRHEFNDKPYLTVGVGIAESRAVYYEAFPMDDVERTLGFVGSALVTGAIGTTIASAAIGWWASKRLLRPVSRVADAAAELASGGLDTRLPPEDDPDLDRLSRSFNDMADAIQARIQRETRFASDVSHEMRSPITALTAAVEVLDARRADLPDRSQQALDVVVNQVRRFDQLVLDLLELSRLDAGTADTHREELRLSEVVSRVAKRYGFSDVPVEVLPGGGQPILIDKRRLERIIANLLDNARQHAGGATRIVLEGASVDHQPAISLSVEDAGPGVAISERTRIFERFARGTASRHRIGTGLGLALVSEHAQSQGGRAWVEDRPGGGSRFTVALPLGTPR